MRGKLAIVTTLMLAGCVPPAQQSPAVAPGAARVTPAPPPAPPQTTDWRDISLTPGAWTYWPGNGQSEARFGSAGVMPAFVIRCNRAARQVVLMRAGASAIEAPLMAITTSAGDRAYHAGTIAGAPGMIGAITAASDPFLDKMAFSRGRFVVVLTGTQQLAIPAWPEFARVIEDCRG